MTPEQIEALSPMDRIAEVMARAAEAAEKLAIDHGGQAVDLALAVARIEALSIVATGFLGAALGAALLYGANRFIRRALVTKDTAEVFNECVGLWLLGVLCAVPGAVVLLVNIGDALSIKAWVGVFYPEYWIAMKALSGLL